MFLKSCVWLDWVHLHRYIQSTPSILIYSTVVSICWVNRNASSYNIFVQCQLQSIYLKSLWSLFEVIRVHTSSKHLCVVICRTFYIFLQVNAPDKQKWRLSIFCSNIKIQCTFVNKMQQEMYSWGSGVKFSYLHLPNVVYGRCSWKRICRGMYLVVTDWIYSADVWWRYSFYIFATVYPKFTHILHSGGTVNILTNVHTCNSGHLTF